jgi:dolichol-phosphate mannosyltransferase
VNRRLKEKNKLMHFGKPMRLSLIIPTYNERDNMESLLERVYAVLNRANSTFEVIIVDDDSPDRTWEVAQALSHKYPNLRVIRRVNERGLAQAVLTGWQHARGAILAVMDGDLQHPPETLGLLIDALEQQRVDIAVASRHVEGGGVSHWNIMRRAISWTATLAATWMLPGTLTTVRDPMSGYFVLRRSVIEGRRLNPKGYKILLEVLARGQYNGIAEIPYTFVERKRGGSKLGPRQYLEFMTHLALLSWNTGELERFVKYCVVGSSGILVNMWIFAALISLELEHLTAGVLAVEAAIATNFVLNEFWVFHDSQRTGNTLKARARRFLTFNLFCAGGAVLNVFILWVLADFLGVNYLLSNFIGIAVATIWNYGTNANITWGTARNDRSGGVGAKMRRAAFSAGQNFEPAKPSFSIDRRWTVFAALWLQVMVLVFVAIQFQRIQTPLSSWFTKIIVLVSSG